MSGVMALQIAIQLALTAVGALLVIAVNRRSLG
ncbi:hypothetical protein F4553_000999 [Allocatelliglobosispora scoriae]|uniref:Uncharacterized protein n=1 Tax=Allocatelliglobosispora scoriae TaxID=643052 RepID=A0A841BLD0_9ACTN|nr:hypothetical protein [Allocatelliglobosispora scoriae]